MIDEAIEDSRENDYEQVAEWLEELKAIKEGIVFYSNRPIEDIVLEARADAIDEILDRLDTGVCEFCEHANENHSCYKCCKQNDDFTDYERETFIKWLKEQKNAN